MKADDLVLKAIYSRSLKSVQETAALNTRSYQDPDLYSADSGPGKSFDDLLARDDIEAVIIALPIPSQPVHIRAALAAGKHVLAEKPLAPTVAEGKELIEYHRGLGGKATFSIAENFRFKPSFNYAASEAAKLGKLQHFGARVFFHMSSDSQWYGTAWRAKPEFQGGFLLDGGVHFTAATRQLLTEPAVDVSAFTAQVQPHLPPIDTVNAVIRVKSGVSGTYQQSCGAKMSTSTFQFEYEKGSVEVDGDKVTVTPWDGEKTVKEFERTSGVTEEVEAWAKALAEGKPNKKQSAEEALADLEFLELMFDSGANGGEVRKYENQL
ncbi:glucose-fructose oxidoreductase [Fusarium heterosporum]|uniref:Glucose-fructose oxidoreductase n=1 Tax=Fusarium heterosporum TaxID=42747 RepID=A0A8H5U321_FUSHE|nr:glucose-fructose oxidoreductase [Fusarium heterosporum]